MSCGIRCVATDVGDAGIILQDTGVLVPVGDRDAVARGIQNIIDCDRQEDARLKKKAIEHIRQNYSVDQLVKNTLNAFNTRC